MQLDCTQFPPNSRQRQVCEGLSELSLERTNRFRVLHGIPPLADLPQTSKARESPKESSSASEPGVSRSGCCGGEEGKILLRNGPGTRLLVTLKAQGFVACKACYALAEKMNDWGDQGCLEHLPEIVEDILPRAMEWKKHHLGWLSPVIPQSLIELAIRQLVLDAIQEPDRA